MKRYIIALFYYLRYPFVIITAKFKFAIGLTSLLQNYISKLDRRFVGLILRKFGAEIGKNVNFNGSVIIDNAAKTKKPFSNLIVGKNCFIGTNSFFDLPSKIILYDDVTISAGVKIITHFDCGDRPLNKYYKRKVGDVTIGKGSFVGVDTIILAGVTIGECCLIGAGSVVIKDVASYTVVSGNPATVIKKLTP